MPKFTVEKLFCAKFGLWWKLDLPLELSHLCYRKFYLFFSNWNDRNSLLQSSKPNKTIICKYWNLSVYICKQYSNVDCFGICFGNVPKLFVTLVIFQSIKLYILKNKLFNLWFFVKKLIILSFAILSWTKYHDNPEKLCFPHGGKLIYEISKKFDIIDLNAIFHEIYLYISTNPWIYLDFRYRYSLWKLMRIIYKSLTLFAYLFTMVYSNISLKIVCIF